MIDDAQALKVVLKSSVVGHETVQDIASTMAEGRVPQVMGESQRFHQILVEA
jgi:hypothetical protein